MKLIKSGKTPTNNIEYEIYELEYTYMIDLYVTNRFAPITTYGSLEVCEKIINEN